MNEWRWRKPVALAIVGAACVAGTTVWMAEPQARADVGNVKIGAPAPAFTATDLRGQPRTLGEFKGKYVVLEWHNQGCPYVKKHYGSGNMQRLQRELTAQGVVWLTVISSAPGKQGNVTPPQEEQYLKDQHAAPTDVLLDPDGTLGRMYGAKTTPHMFLIDPKGMVVYQGAIDDKPTYEVADVEGAKNYVRTAYDEAKAGKPVSASTTAPYGCSVKYKDPD
jgi:peroxiredoxin